MDPTRFDAWTRSFSAARTRRRLLAGLGTLLAAAVLPRRVAAQRGMNPNCPGCWDYQECMAGGTACCTGALCPGADGSESCCGGWSCCGSGCCPLGQVCVTAGSRTVAAVCAGACPEGRVLCGTICCGTDQECGAGDTCVKRCNETETRCGENTCCPQGQTCCGGEACCTADQVCWGNTCLATCPTGTSPCGPNRNCLLGCPPGRILDPTTCTCTCANRRQPCGSICCPPGQECSYDGGEFIGPVCCPRGRSCGIRCAGKWGLHLTICCNPDSNLQCDIRTHTCCGRQRCCPKQTHVCCGDGVCCPKQTQRCVNGTCVPR